jgi:hypothetical protein
MTRTRLRRPMFGAKKALVRMDFLANLFNAQSNQIEYYYLSRLPDALIGDVADRHVHPAEPFAVRVTLAGRF